MKAIGEKVFATSLSKPRQADPSVSDRLTTPEGPLRAAEEPSTSDAFFSALFDFNVKLNHDNALLRKSNKPEVEPQSSLPVVSSAGTLTDPVDSVPNALSPGKGVKILWQ
ncbi:hypothetical protein KCU95_g4392, partial [Aureobasidium melanogenum]